MAETLRYFYNIMFFNGNFIHLTFVVFIYNVQ